MTGSNVPQKYGPMARIKEWWIRFRCPTEFLCDNCRYDHDSACARPQRPNAIKCPDYQPR